MLLSINNIKTDGNDGSVKTFRELSIKASTNVVNETDNRLLKSGKDIKIASLAKQDSFLSQIR